MAAPVVYVRKERNKVSKAANLLQPDSAKPLLKKVRVAAVKQEVAVIAGNMEGNFWTRLLYKNEAVVASHSCTFKIYY